MTANLGAAGGGGSVAVVVAGPGVQIELHSGLGWLAVGVVGVQGPRQVIPSRPNLVG